MQIHAYGTPRGERRGRAEFSRPGARSGTAARSGANYKVDASQTFVADLTRCIGCEYFLGRPLSTLVVGVVLGTAHRVAIHESGRGFVGGRWLQTVHYRPITWDNQSSRNGAGAYG